MMGVARVTAAVIAACVQLLLVTVVDAAGMTFEITVPENVKPNTQDAYVCTTLQLPDTPYKLVGVEPLGEQKVVHHILLYGEFRAALCMHQSLLLLASCIQSKYVRSSIQLPSGQLVSAVAGCDVPYKQPKPGEQSVWDCRAAPACGGFSETIM